MHFSLHDSPHPPTNNTASESLTMGQDFCNSEGGFLKPSHALAYCLMSMGSDERF